MTVCSINDQSHFFFTYRKPSLKKPMAKQKCRFIFKTNGTLKWLNFIDQKILHISEFLIRVKMCHYNNHIYLKKIPSFMFYPGFLSEGLRYMLSNRTLANREVNYNKGASTFIWYILFFLIFSCIFLKFFLNFD